MEGEDQNLRLGNEGAVSVASEKGLNCQVSISFGRICPGALAVRVSIREQSIIFT